jgi:hypothetical protein
VSTDVSVCIAVIPLFLSRRIFAAATIRAGCPRLAMAFLVIFLTVFLTIFLGFSAEKCGKRSFSELKLDSV